MRWMHCVASPLANCFCSMTLGCRGIFTGIIPRSKGCRLSQRISAGKPMVLRHEVRGGTIQVRDARLFRRKLLTLSTGSVMMPSVISFLLCLTGQDEICHAASE